MMTFLGTRGLPPSCPSADESSLCGGGPLPEGASNKGICDIGPGEFAVGEAVGMKNESMMLLQKADAGNPSARDSGLCFRRMIEGNRLLRTWRAVNICQALGQDVGIAAVRDAVEQPTVAGLGVDGTQHDEVGLERHRCTTHLHHTSNRQTALWPV